MFNETQSAPVSTAIQAFDFGGTPIRVNDIDGEPWFIATDVFRVLGIKHANQALASLEADERSTVRIVLGNPNGGNPNRVTISESGLYAIIFRSRKAVAIEFRKWVTKEVLPSIRKTGSYNAPAVKVSSVERGSEILRDWLVWGVCEAAAKRIDVELLKAINSSARAFSELARLEKSTPQLTLAEFSAARQF